MEKLFYCVVIFVQFNDSWNIRKGEISKKFPEIILDKSFYVIMISTLCSNFAAVLVSKYAFLFLYSPFLKMDSFVFQMSFCVE